jgi:hypothetical protein
MDNEHEKEKEIYRENLESPDPVKDADENEWISHVRKVKKSHT